ncbi:MAG: amidase [Hyphomonadaceae bacterium]|nr:amidase [Hyphomonadaceae bacterium]
MAAISHADYVKHDALGLAELVRKKAVSPGELLDAAIARLDAVNPKINAQAHRFVDIAKTQLAAGVGEGPFAGVPFMTKDLAVMVTGAPLTSGSRAWEGFVPRIDSVLTERCRAAGLVIFGSTTSPELGLTATTENKIQGDTHNPWKHGHIAGGSSGGAAAVVSAGVIPMAQASDGGGSIRTPASCCGLFGLKPSRGRVPLGPLRTEGWNGMSVVGAVSRSVRDSAAFLDAVGGIETGARYDATPAPGGGFLAALSSAPMGLRIALWTKTYDGADIDPECAGAAVEAAKLCESLGHTVEEIQPPVDGPALAQAFMPILMTSVFRDLEDRGAARGAPVRDDEIEPLTAFYRARAAEVTGVQLQAAIATQQRAAIKVAQFMQTYDLLLTPTQGTPPPKLGVLSLSQPDFAQYGRDMGAFGPYTALANHTGQPAMSVPLTMSRGGLPIGVMFLGRYGAEATLLSLAAQLEAARPWKDRLPVV